MFVQPSGEHLLGMNALPVLGVTVCPTNSDLLLPSPEQPEVATVHLVQAERIPWNSGVFVQANVEGNYKEGDELIFEIVLSTHGLIFPDSVVTV